MLYLDSNGELVSDIPPGGGFLAILAVLRALNSGLNKYSSGGGSINHFIEFYYTNSLF